MQLQDASAHAARSVSSFLGVLTMATVTLTMRMSPWLDYGLIFPGHKGPAHDWDIPSHHHHKSDRERWDAAWGYRRSQADYVCNTDWRANFPCDDFNKALIYVIWLGLRHKGWQEDITRIGDGVHIWNLVTGDSVTVSVVWCVMSEYIRSWNVINNLSLQQNYSIKGSI